MTQTATTGEHLPESERQPGWAGWCAHFERRAGRPLPDLAGLGEEVPPAWRAALVWSLARFQLGESHGSGVVSEIHACSLRSIDDHYRAALALFVEEEHRHGEILARIIDALGGRRLTRTWTDDLFRLGRNLLGVRLKMLVLLVAEVIGDAFYSSLAGPLPDGKLRNALEEIIADERHHLQFHCQFLRGEIRNAFALTLLRLLWWPLAGLANAVVLYDHRKTLRTANRSRFTLVRNVLRLVREVDRRLAARSERGAQDPHRRRHPVPPLTARS